MKKIHFSSWSYKKLGHHNISLNNARNSEELKTLVTIIKIVATIVFKLGLKIRNVGTNGH
jgi:hypothetical protein